MELDEIVVCLVAAATIVVASFNIFWEFIT